jgi:hypothetical protein
MKHHPGIWADKICKANDSIVCCAYIVSPIDNNNDREMS